MNRALLGSVLGAQTILLSRLLPVSTVRDVRFLHQTWHMVEPTQLAPQSDTGALMRQAGKRKSTLGNNKPGALSPAAANINPTSRSQITTPLSPPPYSSPTRITTLSVDSSLAALFPLLAAQPAHYITVHIHGRPYLVTPGDAITLPFLMHGVRPGDVLRLNRASVLGSRDFTLQGAPHVDESLYECRAIVLGAETEPMRIMVKKKQRCRREKHVRSKHRYTVLRISELKVHGEAGDAGAVKQG